MLGEQGQGVWGLISGEGAGPEGWGWSTVRSNASWIIVRWPFVNRQTDRHDWKHYLAATLLAGGNNTDNIDDNGQFMIVKARFDFEKLRKNGPLHLRHFGRTSFITLKLMIWHLHQVFVIQSFANYFLVPHFLVMACLCGNHFCSLQTNGLFREMEFRQDSCSIRDFNMKRFTDWINHWSRFRERSHLVLYTFLLIIWSFWNQGCFFLIWARYNCALLWSSLPKNTQNTFVMFIVPLRFIEVL